MQERIFRASWRGPSGVDFIVNVALRIRPRFLTTLYCPSSRQRRINTCNLLGDQRGGYEYMQQSQEVIAVVSRYVHTRKLDVARVLGLCTSAASSTNCSPQPMPESRSQKGKLIQMPLQAIGQCDIPSPGTTPSKGHADGSLGANCTSGFGSCGKNGT